MCVTIPKCRKSKVYFIIVYRNFILKTLEYLIIFYVLIFRSSSARLFAFSAMGLIVVGAGSTLIFAKYNPKLREIVQAHFPMADQIIKTVWQEGKLETSDTEDSP